MHNKHTYILDKLRRLDKLGRKQDDADKKKADALEASAIQKLINLLPEASILTKAYSDAVDSLTTDQNNLSMGLGKVIAIQDKFNSKIVATTKNITFLEEYNSELNKTFAIGSARAQEYAETLRGIGISIGFGDKKMFKFAAGLNDLTNGMLMSSKITKTEYRDSMFAFQATAQEMLGVSAEAATGFESYAALMGTSAKNASRELVLLSAAAANDMGIDSLTAQHDILEGIGSLSEEIRLNYSKIPGSLEVAVLKAKALGFTMEQLDQVGESLLNIEQSVGQEIEYQLLSGKRLLTQDNKSFTNEFRLAKLTGDAKKEAELMGDILERQGDTLRTNYMARKKFADLTGMSDKELSAVLAKDKIAKELGIDELRKLSGKELKTKVDQLKAGYTKQGKKSEAEIKKLDELMASQDIRTTHEKVVEDNLVQIANTISKIGGQKYKTVDGKEVPDGFKIDVGAISKGVRDAFKNEETFVKIKTAFDGGAKAFGALTLRTEVSNDILIETMTTIGTGITDFTKKVGNLVSGLTKYLKFKMDTGTGHGGAKPSGDVLIKPNKGPMLKPAKNDVIMAFRPNDVIHNTVNEMVKPNSSGGSMAAMIAVLEKTIRGTQQQNNNVNVTIDTAKLANDFAIAMQSVKVEAKLRTDDIYSPNRMNNRKNII